MKIVVVGNGRATRTFLKSIKKIYEEAQVLWISSGEEAVSLHASLKPDVILMDILQPGMGGIESARAIREQDGKIKIVLVSEYFNAEFLSAARETKLNGYLIRTYDPDILRKAIDEVCKGGRFLLLMR